MNSTYFRFRFVATLLVLLFWLTTCTSQGVGGCCDDDDYYDDYGSNYGYYDNEDNNYVSKSYNKPVKPSNYDNYNYNSKSYIKHQSVDTASESNTGSESDTGKNDGYNIPPEYSIKQDQPKSQTKLQKTGDTHTQLPKTPKPQNPKTPLSKYCK